MKEFKYEIRYTSFTETYKMNMESLKIKTKANYDWDDAVYICDTDPTSIEIIKRESKIGVNICYIGYIPEHNSNIISLYLVINRLNGFIEEIKGTSDRYLVVNTGDKKIIHNFDELWKTIENKITSNSSVNKINQGLILIYIYPLAS